MTLDNFRTLVQPYTYIVFIGYGGNMPKCQVLFITDEALKDFGKDTTSESRLCLGYNTITLDVNYQTKVITTEAYPTVKLYGIK